MRLVTTNLTYNDIKPKLRELVDLLFKRVPAGVGSEGFVKLNANQFKEAISTGAKWAIEQGYGWEEDLERIEENGCVDGDVAKVSDRAIKRGINQIGTLGSGNHYLEIQVAKPENIFDKDIAKVYGINQDNQVVVMFHCLPGNAKILTEYGYTVAIENFEKQWKATKVKCMDVDSHKVEDTNAIKFYKIKPCGKMFKITTRTGKELKATEDHPVLTPKGLRLMNEIKTGERVAIMPFEGMEYEEPSDEALVSEEDVRKIENNERIINNLKKLELLPLRLNSPKLPILAKLLGFLTGDGWLGKTHDSIHGKRRERWCLKFIGKPEDLEEIKKDIEKLGFNAASYSQKCKSNVTYTDGEKRTIDGTTNTIVVGSLSLPILLYALGAPFGNKSKQQFEVPKWIVKSPLWIKRLYLAGYFGAEMTRPCIRVKEKYRFGNPTVSLNKVNSIEENGRIFLSQIGTLLDEFGIKIIKITRHTGVVTKSGEKTVKLRLKLSSKEENLRKLWTRIGFEYCTERTNLSLYAAQYLKLKQKLLEKESVIVNKNETKLSITPYEYRSVDYPTFDEYKAEFKLNPPTPIIWDVIEKIEEIADFNGYVYDITVNHHDHNFIADSFVTGNCGSRGFGHQVATDYLQTFLSVMERKYGIKILDRELACAPFQSKEGQDYFAAMKCGLNMSFANRQVILHRIRECFEKVLGQKAEDMDMRCVYDVAHNTAKLEKHNIDGKQREVLVHRKGATRAFGPGREEVPSFYRHVGQPVIIGGSMETGSYLLAGTEGAMQKTFGSTCHGAGRTMSRTRAKQLFRGDKLLKDMEQRGILVRSVSMSGLAEEAGDAYKNIDTVIDAVHEAGISKKIVKLVPVGNVKG